MANFQLADDAKLNPTLTVTDDQGNPVAGPAGAAPVWSSSDATIFTVDSSADPTGLSAVLTTTGKLGTAQVQVAAFGLTGAAAIDVVASAAAQITISLGTATKR